MHFFQIKSINSATSNNVNNLNNVIFVLSWDSPYQFTNMSKSKTKPSFSLKNTNKQANKYIDFGLSCLKAINFIQAVTYVMLLLFTLQTCWSFVDFVLLRHSFRIFYYKLDVCIACLSYMFLCNVFKILMFWIWFDFLDKLHLEWMITVNC